MKIIIISFCMLWFFLFNFYHQYHIFPANLSNKNFSIRGIITTIPDQTNEKSQFLLTTYAPFPMAYHLKLTWHNAPQLNPWDEWLLPVKLFTPHGFLNPGGFNYARWLFSQHIDGTGFVLVNGNSQLLNTHPYLYFLSNLRNQIALFITHTLASNPLAPMIIALTVGIRHNITPEQ